MTPEQIGLYQAVIDSLVVATSESEQGSNERRGRSRSDYCVEADL